MTVELLLIAVIIYVFPDYADLHLNVITAILGSMAMLYVSVMISRCRRLEKCLEIMSEYSYGIYLMSPFVMVPIRVFLYKRLEAPYLLCMVMMLSLGFGVPYLFIKYVVRKVGFLKGILLGE